MARSSANLCQERVRTHRRRCRQGSQALVSHVSLQLRASSPASLLESKLWRFKIHYVPEIPYQGSYHKGLARCMGLQKSCVVMLVGN